MQREGCRFYLYFFWLPGPEMAIQRVAQRVLSGGHDIPEPVIRCRSAAGLNNFFALYRPLANLTIPVSRIGQSTFSGAWTA